MKKLMVIGIDGVPYGLLKGYGQSNVMPNTGRLIQQYGLHRTRAPLPEISSVSWTSFMTGMNPGQHGVYGFMEINPLNYGYRFPSFRSLPVRTLWERLEISGLRAIIINLPSTYPVRPISGILVAGFVALDLKKAVYPESRLGMLQRMDYQVDVDTTLAQGEKPLFLKELHRILDQRLDLYRRFVLEPWDLFTFVVTGTDRINHFFFKAWNDRNVPFHGEFLDYYRHLDRVIGEVVANMEERGIPFIILSDHGFVKLKQDVHLANYMEHWGYLDLQGDSAKGPKRITNQSMAFPLDPTRIYIHGKGKYARGSVNPGDDRIILEELKARFQGLKIDGENVIHGVFEKDEIYRGPFMDRAPDLVLVANEGFNLKAGYTRETLHEESIFQGMHCWDNAILIDAAGLEIDGSDVPSIDAIGRGVEHYLEG